MPQKTELYGLYVSYVVPIGDFGMLRVKEFYSKVHCGLPVNNPLGRGLIVIDVLLCQGGAVELVQHAGEGHDETALGLLGPHGKQILLGV